MPVPDKGLQRPGAGIAWQETQTSSWDSCRNLGERSVENSAGMIDNARAVRKSSASKQGLDAMSNEELKRKYRWQCRRGASEVEVVLYAYLDNHFDDDSAENQGRFERLLACQDAD
ncbi:MAG: succinate dehydrogenase assembly factor 2, partial [Alcanivorax nanhaiticus]